LKPLPSDIDSEKALLGAVFLDAGILGRFDDRPEAFDKQAHRLIYAAMKDLAHRNEPIDFVSVSGLLNNRKELEQAGGAEYLLELTDFTPTAANADYYLARVRDAYLRRQGIIRFRAVSGGFWDSEKPLADTCDEVRAAAVGLAGEVMNTKTGELLTWQERQRRYSDYIKDIDRLRFLTKFPPVDDLLRGCAPGEVITLAAYSGTFKTALLYWLLIQNAMATGLYYIFFSLEMSAAKLFERETMQTTGLTGRQVERAYRNGRVIVEHDAVKKLIVVDRSRLSLEKIGAFVEQARLKFGEIGGIGIDYLGLVAAPGRDPYERIQHTAIETKNLAKSLNIPVVLLSQTSRAYAPGAKREMEADAAKGSGDIEAACDFMLGLWQSEDRRLLLKILKNRNGPAGNIFEIALDRSCLRFGECKSYERKSGKGEPDLPF
jgi:replicative DNA helicase